MSADNLQSATPNPQHGSHFGAPQTPDKSRDMPDGRSASVGQASVGSSMPSSPVCLLPLHTPRSCSLLTQPRRTRVTEHSTDARGCRGRSVAPARRRVCAGSSLSLRRDARRRLRLPASHTALAIVSNCRDSTRAPARPKRPPAMAAWAQPARRDRVAQTCAGHAPTALHPCPPSLIPPDEPAASIRPAEPAVVIPARDPTQPGAAGHDEGRLRVASTLSCARPRQRLLARHATAAPCLAPARCSLLARVRVDEQRAAHRREGWRRG
eukprot:3201654-Rhodomonas_salina.2